MRRREFIRLLGGAVAWPLNARAQQEQVRIGIISGVRAEDLNFKARIAAFLQELQRLGWTERRNLRIDIRTASGNVAAARTRRTSSMCAASPPRTSPMYR
jgi:putative ABC transport system substrate-binding protein